MSRLTRRQFIGGAAAATGVSVVGGAAIERVLDADASGGSVLLNIKDAAKVE